MHARFSFFDMIIKYAYTRPM